jgi:hypothetical protein
MSTEAPARMVPVKRLVDDLGRQELRLKLAGAYAEAAGIRDAIVRILRLADEGEPSLEPSEPI